MDPINLSYGQNFKINSKNTASNTTPIACAFCGSKDYVPTNPTANCFTPFWPVMPNCLPSSNNCEDNFGIPQPFLYGPSLFQPFFNTPLPQNKLHGPPYPGLHHSSEESKKGVNEKEQLPWQTKTCNGIVCNRTVERNQELGDCQRNKNEDESGNVTHLPSHQNSNESTLNPFTTKGCGCTGSIPWTCNSFVVPIISYYVLWNSQRSNFNAVFSPSPYAQSVNIIPKENGDVIRQEFAETEMKNSSLVKAEKIFQESFPTDVKMTKNECQENAQTDKSSSNTSLPQLNTTEEFIDCSSETLADTENLLKDEKDGLEDNISSEEISPESKTEQKEELKYEIDIVHPSNLASSISSVSSVKSNSNCNIQPVEIDDVVDESKEAESSTGKGDRQNENQPPNLEVSSASIGAADLKQFPKQISEECNLDSSKKADEKIANGPKDQVTKKFIKNFTVTDELNNKLPDKSNENALAAAAGDLGGEHCVGYKVNIPLLQEDNTRQSSAHENSIQKETPGSENVPEDTKIPPRNKPENSSEKIADEVKSASNFKTNIAKLSPNYKRKETKSEILTETTKQGKINLSKDSIVPKRKHNCGATNNGAENNGINLKKQEKLKNLVQTRRSNRQNVRNGKADSKSQTGKGEIVERSTKIHQLGVKQDVKPSSEKLN